MSITAQTKTVSASPAPSALASWARRAAIGGITVVSGAAVGLRYAAVNNSGHLGHLAIVLLALAGAAIVAGAAIALQWGTRRAIRELPAEAAWLVRRYDPLAYSPLLLSLVGAWGLWFPPLPVLLVAVVAIKGLILYVHGLGREQRRQLLASRGWLAFLFLISGFAALIYQIVWQRALFTAFGVNIESITVIVSLFMLGLGLGSLAGGLLSKRFAGRAPLLFLLCELGIGLFGVASLPLIGGVSRLTLHGSPWTISLAVFALLFAPTLLMGATLPILVAHLYRFYHNVGRSVGLLYAINTIGSAIACFLTADLLFVLTGQQGAVRVAALCNLTVGVLVWRYARRLARAGGAGAGAGASGEVESAPVDPAQATGPWRQWVVLILAAAVGYISLSQEIVWMRVVGYMTGGRPSDFAHVLGFFLLGVAGGALFGKWACQRWFAAGGGSPIRLIGVMLVVSGAFYHLSIALAASLHHMNNLLGLAVTHLVVTVVAFLLGAVFPILCHHGTRAGQSVGVAVSRIYLANIVGSTAGPLLTGFVLMDRFGTSQIIAGLSIATLLLGGTAWSAAQRRRLVPVAAAAALAAGLVFAHPVLYTQFFERLHPGGVGGPYKYLVENRSGVIAVTAESNGDGIYGGGMYDGTFNLDPVVNSNRINRCYMVAVLHPAPRDVLEIGLSGGSWACILADYQPIRSLTSVEINPGYLALIGRYDDHRPLLTHPKVTIHIDDGRRWLNRNPDRKFDLIVQNTTWHWRSQITNLISEEYLRLCKAHLNEGGVIYYNTTDCAHIPYTAARVFRHVVRYSNFVAASDRPFCLTPEQVRANLLKFRDPAGQPVLGSARTARLLEEFTHTPLRDQGDALRARTDRMCITDDNMATEYKLFRGVRPELSWGALWRGEK